jgi:thiol-disulfide isomerase/thioredoxin
MKRRVVIVAGVAGAAGVGAALWRQRSPAVGPGEAIWSRRFEIPAGGQLAFSTLRGQPLLLNFWATWCPPCVRELPLLDEFQRRHAARGWRVAGLAVDNATPVREFLRQHPIAFDIGLAGADGLELSRSLGNATGALPFSVVFDRRGVAVQRKLGVIEPSDLDTWVRSIA